MDRSMHNMTNLFAQLGLKNSNEDIEFFIAANRGLQKEQTLAEAEFWSKGQQQIYKKPFSSIQIGVKLLIAWMPYSENRIQPEHFQCYIQ